MLLQITLYLISQLAGACRFQGTFRRKLICLLFGFIRTIMRSRKTVRRTNNVAAWQ